MPVGFWARRRKEDFSINEFIFDESTHTYTLDGKVLPSVTEIVGMIDFGSLRKLNPAVLEHAALRGTLVHEYCEAIDNGYAPDELEVETELSGYVKAYLDFLRDYGPKWELVEQPMHEADRYAGTVDRYGTIDGKPCVVDIKTTESADKHTRLKWAVQLAGYDRMIFSSMDAKQVSEWLILQLKKDGTYMLRNVFDEFPEAFDIFSLLEFACSQVKGLLK